MMQSRTVALLAMAALSLAVAAPPAVAQNKASSDQAGAKVEVQSKKPFGQFLVDGENRPLYLLKADIESTGQEPISTCYDACAKEWPPFTSQGDPSAGPDVDASLLSTTERTDGTRQVTYDGRPLYYYHEDKAGGAIKGQDVHDEWGEWYLVAPSGEPIEAEGGSG